MRRRASGPDNRAGTTHSPLQWPHRDPRTPGRGPTGTTGDIGAHNQESAWLRDGARDTWRDWSPTNHEQTSGGEFTTLAAMQARCYEHGAAPKKA